MTGKTHGCSLGRAPGWLADRRSWRQHPNWARERRRNWWTHVLLHGSSEVRVVPDEDAGHDVGASQLGEAGRMGTHRHAGVHVGGHRHERGRQGGEWEGGSRRRSSRRAVLLHHRRRDRSAKVVEVHFLVLDRMSVWEAITGTRSTYGNIQSENLSPLDLQNRAKRHLTVLSRD